MADNYFQFSFFLHVTFEELAWLETICTEPEDDDSLGFDSVGFETGDADLNGITGAYFYATDLGGYVDDFEQVVDILQRFLEQFRPNDALILTFAYSCSRPHPGEFGGGAVLVTATHNEWCNPDQYLTQRAHTLGLQLIPTR